MLRHEYLQWVILRYTISVDGENERPTSWTSLENEVRACGISASGNETKDTLLLLLGRGLLTLKKHHRSVVTPPVVIFEYGEYEDKEEFFKGEFRMLATPEGRAYFYELEAKVPAIAPPKAHKIGF